MGLNGVFAESNTLQPSGEGKEEEEGINEMSQESIYQHHSTLIRNAGKSTNTYLADSRKILACHHP